ncbi:hypothetical protein GO009_02200 [Muricauda sp. TY007]|uniref:hypothetical protein n=1 Tax=Allomuricauda sp. TY007 TaxID=2683200 RepID=UPI0013BF38DB|nr:hypothetical protein [Muricauda sp. TY007]NDV14823.1 hypothetical protein [Muricauda sp. TY007]
MPWLKIIISFIAVGITVVEVWDFRKKRKNKNWQKLKKPIIIISSLLLLLLTVWDEINDENKNKIEEERRDAQIVQDSIRASQIILNLGNALNKIDSSAQNLVKVDSSIGIVRNSINEQVNQLTSIVSESKEIQNNLTGGDSYIKLFLVKRWRTQSLELLCTVMGKYPMHNINLYITCSSFQDSLLKESINLEPLVNGNGSNMAFEVRLSSLTSNIATYSIAKFDVNDFKDDIKLSIWAYSNNGSTFQMINWKNHKRYLSSPRKTGSASLTGSNNTDWSGKSFEYTSIISRVTPVERAKMRDNVIDNSAGLYYYENYMAIFNLQNTILVN